MNEITERILAKRELNKNIKTGSSSKSSLVNIPISLMPNGSPVLLTDIFPYIREIDSVFYNYNSTINELISVVTPPIAISKFVILTASQTLVVGTAYSVAVAGNIVGTLPAATGSGALISLTSLSTNTALSNLVGTIFFTGVSYPNLTSNAPFTVYLRDSAAGIWNVETWLSAGDVIHG